MVLVNALVSALPNLFLFAGLPFLLYYSYHKYRKKRGFAEIVQRAGLQLGEVRYIGYCLMFAVVVVTTLILCPPSLESSILERSALRAFDGLGFGIPTVVMALFYGVIETGFLEEFLFRGLITGSLSRHLSIPWANVLQAFIFLTPHLFLLRIMPELLPFIFILSLFLGWVRIKSGSMMGPWLIHASINVTMGLSVAIRTAS
jgi:membrane protease YdiL (CAAX protease family)